MADWTLRLEFEHITHPFARSRHEIRWRVRATELDSTESPAVSRRGQSITSDTSHTRPGLDSENRFDGHVLQCCGPPGDKLPFRFQCRALSARGKIHKPEQWGR